MYMKYSSVVDIRGMYIKATMIFYWDSHWDD